MKEAVNNTPFVLLTGNDKSYWQQYTVEQQEDSVSLFNAERQKSAIKQFNIRVDADGVLKNFSTAERDGQVNLISIAKYYQSSTF